MAGVSIEINADDLKRVEKAIAQLPADIRHKAAARAMKRMAEMGRTRIVNDVRDLVQIPRKHVFKRTKTYYDYVDLSLETSVKSGFIPLIEIGGRRVSQVLNKTRAQTERRLKKKGKELKGSYRAAFKAKMARGEGIFRREGDARGPVDEQFGPNPAHAVQEHPERYEKLLNQVLMQYLLPRMLHEISRELPK